MNDAQPEASRVYLTPGGVLRLRRRITETRAAYMEVCADNEAAAESGDSSVWHDNFAYEENQRRMHQLARRVRDLEETLARVQVAPVDVSPPETVRVGARVRLAWDDGRPEQLLFIAGYEDGDPEAGRIGYTAPLARALVGAEEGDTRVVGNGGRARAVEAVEILGAPEEELQA